MALLEDMRKQSQQRPGVHNGRPVRNVVTKSNIIRGIIIEFDNDNDNSDNDDNDNDAW